MKRRNALALVSVVLILTGCGGESPPAGTSGTGEKIFIGLAGPITGPNAPFGEDMLRSAQLAVEEINAAGGVLGKQVEIVEGDDASDPKQAAIIGQKMVSTEGLVGVIGHFNSGCSIPASQIYNRANLAMISPGSTDPKLTEQGFTNVFRMVGRDDQQGPLGATFALDELKSKTFVLINDKTAYGQGLAKAFQAEVVAKGAKVLAFEGVAVGDKDFRGLLTKVKGLNPDTIFFGGVYTEAALILNQARETGYTGNFMSGDGTQVQEFITTVGTRTDKIFLTQVKPVDSDKFLDAYKKKFNNATPTGFGTYTYDATKLLLQAVATTGSIDREAIVTTLKATKDFAGLAGPVNFDAKGDPVIAPFEIFMIQDQQFVPYKPAKT